ncbi:MAG: DUF4148 domain-containing protein [Aquabacterium sp.]|nr:DUF4148 domain-containing protein [Aquabacterium sp.]
MAHTRQRFILAAIATASLLSAGAAFAQEATPDTWMVVSSHQTRAAVVADLAAARQAGLAKTLTEGYIEPVGASTVQRADVRQQTLQAIRSGEIKAINAEVAGLAPAAAAPLRHAG